MVVGSGGFGHLVHQRMMILLITKPCHGKLAHEAKTDSFANPSVGVDTQTDKSNNEFYDGL